MFHVEQIGLYRAVLKYFLEKPRHGEQDIQIVPRGTSLSEEIHHG